jgi:hypothetical protein
MAYDEIPIVPGDMPLCDVCKAKGCQPVKPAKYDSRLNQYNTWGYTCHTHFHEYGVKSTASKLVEIPVNELPEYDGILDD